MADAPPSSISWKHPPSQNAGHGVDPLKTSRLIKSLRREGFSDALIFQLFLRSVRFDDALDIARNGLDKRLRRFDPNYIKGLMRGVNLTGNEAASFFSLAGWVEIARSIKSKSRL